MRGERLVAPAAAALGAVHREVRVAHQVVGRVRAGRDPDAAAQENLLAADLERLLERAQDPPCQVLEVDARGVLDQNRELVTAEAGGRVSGAHAAQQPLPDGDEQFIAGDVAEAVVDGLELVEVAEQDRDVGAGRLGARERLTQPIAQQGPVGKLRERVVQRLVDRVLNGAGVGQGDARVLGEGDEDLALGGRVGVVGEFARDDEAADDGPALAHRGGHRRAHAVAGPFLDLGRVVAVALDHDEVPFGDRSPARALADPPVAPLLDRLVGDPVGCDDHHPGRVVAVDQPERDGVVAEERGGPVDDRPQHVVDGEAADDRALDPREALEQLVALAQRSEQAFVLLAPLLAELPLGALGLHRADRLQGHHQHAGGRPQQVGLLTVERRPEAGEQEAVALGLPEWDRDRLASPDAGDLERVGPPLGHGAEPLQRRHVGAEADRGEQALAGDDRRGLRFRHLRGSLDRDADRRVAVLAGRDRSDELGELLGRPPAGRRAEPGPARLGRSAHLNRGRGRRASGCAPRLRLASERSRRACRSRRRAPRRTRRSAPPRGGSRPRRGCRGGRCS